MKVLGIELYCTKKYGLRDYHSHEQKQRIPYDRNNGNCEKTEIIVFLSRWEPVRRAADNIIREKNMIIDKLKNRILELEEDYRSVDFLHFYCRAIL